MTDLSGRAGALERRLEDGWTRIESAPIDADVTAWEDFWLRLLAEYEAVCREMDFAYETRQRDIEL